MNYVSECVHFVLIVFESDIGCTDFRCTKKEHDGGWDVVVEIKAE